MNLPAHWIARRFVLIAIHAAVAGAISSVCAAGTGAGAPDAATLAKLVANDGFEAAERGDWRAAEEAYRRAYALNGDPGFLYSVGRAQQQAGDLLGAVRTFRRVLSLPRAGGFAAQARTRLREIRAARRRPAPPPVTVAAPRALPARMLASRGLVRNRRRPAVPLATFSDDDGPWLEPTWRDGTPYVQFAPSSAPSSAPSADRASWAQLRPVVAWSAAGLGIATTFAGIATLADAEVDYRALQDRRRPDGSYAGRTFAEATEAVVAINTQIRVGWIVTAAGLVGAGAGGYLLLTGRERSEAGAVLTPWVSPRRGTVGVRGSWKF